jgi:phage tail-like protein
MAGRAVSSDFLHNMRFHVSVDDNTLLKQTNPSGDTASAGFMQASTPDVSVAAVSYREGQYIYTRKQPGGIPEMTDVQLSRGVALFYSDLWQWLRYIIEGAGDYRANVTIKHFPREALPNASANKNVRENPNSAQTLNIGRGTYRAYYLFESFPVQHKVASDLDSGSSEISIQNLTLTYESFEVEDLKAGAGVPEV